MMPLTRRTVLAGGAACAATPAFAAGIAEETFLRAGTLDQWVRIEGADIANPVILVVHGGPGEAQGPMMEKYRPWTRDFTVVLWDQRGAGHNYGRYGDKTPDMTLDAIARDGIQIAEQICSRLGKRKLILLGHSWGTIVAASMLQLRPQLFAAYVGTGQVESWSALVNFQFDLLLARARHDNDQDSIRMLEAIGRPDPKNAAQYFAFSKNMRAMMAPSDQDWIAWQRTHVPIYFRNDPQGLKDYTDGFDFSARSVLPDQMKTDLTVTAARVDTAFFIIQGAEDVVTPTAAARDYFGKVTAPIKDMTVLPDAGHFAFMTAGAAFLAALIQKVRPVAMARGA